MTSGEERQRRVHDQFAFEVISLRLALYRQWRPQTFSEVRGQEHIVQVLQSALRLGRISHAYMFSGPRGTGKTSVARILAKALNCKEGPAPEPCNSCSTCTSITQGRSVDVLEIDAASNRGIDEIRDLREKVHFHPAEGRYRVYIIDEVHMLTPEAFNALLKTVEEPPNHAVFILATTELHKVPLTLLSRCQRFDFRRLSINEITEHLKAVAASEAVSIDSSGAAAIASSSDGALRDALSYLELASLYTQDMITEEVVWEVLGKTKRSVCDGLARAIQEKDAHAILETVDKAMSGGADVRQLLRDFMEYLREQLFALVSGQGSKPRTERVFDDVSIVTSLLGKLAELEVRMKSSSLPRITLEAGLVDIAVSTVATKSEAAGPKEVLIQLPAKTAEGNQVIQKTGVPGELPSEASEATVSPVCSPSEEVVCGLAADEPRKPAETPPSDTFNTVLQNWSSIMENVKKVSLPVHAFLLASKPARFESGALTLEFNLEFHKEKASVPENLRVIEREIEKVTGVPLRVICKMARKVSGDIKDTASTPTGTPSQDMFVEAAAKDMATREREHDFLIDLSGAFDGEIVPGEWPGE